MEQVLDVKANMYFVSFNYFRATLKIFKNISIRSEFDPNQKEAQAYNLNLSPNETKRKEKL